MMNFKKILPLLGLLLLLAVTFIACEQDFVQDEAEFGEIEYRNDRLRPKIYAVVLCPPGPDDTSIADSCQGMGSGCRKRAVCSSVEKMSEEEYQVFWRESFAD